MRLWHQDLIPLLPRQQLLGQHRECCALRGLGWGKKHATVDYVFDHPPSRLFIYHQLVMAEMQRRGYRVAPQWLDRDYRGRRCAPLAQQQSSNTAPSKPAATPIYPEHDRAYWEVCVAKLRAKGIRLSEIGDGHSE